MGGVEFVFVVVFAIGEEPDGAEGFEGGDDSEVVVVVVVVTWLAADDLLGLLAGGGDAPVGCDEVVEVAGCGDAGGEEG